MRNRIRLFPGTVRNLMRLILLAVLVPVVLVQAGIYFSWLQSRRQLEIQGNEELARAIAQAFSAHILDIQRQEYALGHVLVSSPKFSRASANALLRRSATAYPTIRRLNWLNSQGQIVASSSTQNVGVNAGDRAYFREIVRGQDRTVSDLIVSRANGELIFLIAQGIRTDDGTLRGVVTAAVNPEKLGFLALNIGRVKEGAFAIIDSAGRCIYDSTHPATGWRARDWRSQYPQIQQALVARNIAGLFKWGHRGQRSFTAIHRVEPMGWLVAASRPESVMMAPMIRSIGRDFGLVLLVAVVAFFVAARLSRRITSPVRRLQQDALAFGAGALDRRAELTGPVEVYGLATAFNEMAETIQAQQEEFVAQNEELQAQQEELAAQNEELQAQQEELQSQHDELAQLSRELEHARRKAEQRAEEAEEGRRILHALMDYIPEGITIADAPDTTIRMVSAYGQQLTGRPYDSLAGISAAAHPESWAIYHLDGITMATADELPLTRATERGEVVTDEEWIMRRPDGTDVTILTNAGPIRDRDGRITGGVIAWRDITGRKHAEELHERERAFLSSAIEILPLPILFVGPTGELVLANTACRKMLGYSDDRKWWQRLQFLSADTHTPISLEQRPLFRALRGETTTSLETLLAHPDGSEYPMLLQAAPITVRGETVAAVEILQDISFLKAEDRAKDQFLAVLSHELLTPLTSILGWLQLLDSDRENPVVAGQALTVITRNAHRQKRLVDDLLDISRIVHGKLLLKPEPVDLWRLVEQQVESVQQIASEQHVTVALESPADALLIYADPARTGQVISNLLTNALKFTGEGGTVTLCGTSTSDSVTIAIRDSGKGIAPDLLTEIFKPFRQLQRNERTGGLGLGLALVKGIVELHSGQVTATSSGSGQGSVFTVTFPRFQPSDSPTLPGT